MKPRIRQNVWGNWYGYLGNRRVEAFANGREYSMERAAQNWLAEQMAEGLDRPTVVANPQPMPDTGHMENAGGKMKLTELESKVLQELYHESGSNGHDFGVMECVSVAGMKRQAIGGVVANLVIKEILTVHPTERIGDRPVTQYEFLPGAKPYIAELGLEIPYKCEEGN